jgi:hypothetical protein
VRTDVEHRVARPYERVREEGGRLPGTVPVDKAPIDDTVLQITVDVEVRLDLDDETAPREQRPERGIDEMLAPRQRPTLKSAPDESNIERLARSHRGLRLNYNRNSAWPFMRRSLIGKMYCLHVRWLYGSAAALLPRRDAACDGVVLPAE